MKENLNTNQKGVTFMKLTKHYVERYFERVLEKALPNDRGPLELESMVKGDMDLRMDTRQINNMSFISGSGSRAKIPMGKEHLVVAKNNTALTILYV